MMKPLSAGARGAHAGGGCCRSHDAAADRSLLLLLLLLRVLSHVWRSLAVNRGGSSQRGCEVSRGAGKPHL